VNPDKPIVVPAGSDNFDDILKNLPKGSDRFDFIGPRGISRDVMNSWSQIFAQYFGPSKLTDEDMLLVEDDGIEKPNGQTNEQAASSDFPEVSVDEARAQRDALLEQYRKEAERKRRMELGGGRSSSDRKSKSSSRASVKSSSSRSAAAEAK
jgi:hypothetical protein